MDENLNIPKIYNDPVLFKKRRGDKIDPFKEIKESGTVEKHYVLLSEVPNRYRKVKVTNRGQKLHEVENEYLTPTTFTVDYTNGVVYFHSSMQGKTLDFEYQGEGVYLFPDSRVYRTDDPNFPNLRDKITDIDREILVQKNRVDEQIRSVPQPSEVVDMRIDRNGKIFPVAKDRIDAEQFKIEEAYVDAHGKKYSSLKKRIDSLQYATDELEDETGKAVGSIWASIDLIPGKISLETGRLEEKIDGKLNLMTSKINMTPEMIDLEVSKVQQWADGKFSEQSSSIKVLSNRIDLKVDVDGVVSSINLSKEGVRVQGSKIWLTGDTRIDNAVIKSAHIDSLSASKIRTGLLRSENDNTVWNLNTGSLSMKNAEFTIGNGGRIHFTDPSNKIMYAQDDPQTSNRYYVGLGLGRNINKRFPFVYMGTTKNATLTVNERVHFTGFISNTGDRIEIDDASNSVVGDRFHVRDKAKGYVYGFRFDLSENVKTLRGMNTHHDGIHYDIGEYNRRFRNVFTYNIRHNGEVRIRDSRDGRTGGWLMQTHYAGDGSAITLRGLNGGKYNYSIGGKQSYNRIRTIFLRNKPNVSSDARLKEDIKESKLGLDFVKSLKPTEFRFKKTTSEDIENKKEFGFIAQEVEDSMVINGLNPKKYSLLSKDDDGFYAMEHEQLIAPIVNAVTEIDEKFANENRELVKKLDKNEKDVKLLIESQAREIEQLRSEVKLLKNKLR